MGKTKSDKKYKYLLKFDFCVVCEKKVYLNDINAIEINDPGSTRISTLCADCSKGLKKENE